MLLMRWMLDEGLSYSALGRRTRLAPSTVRKHAMGLLHPRPQQVARYFVASDGRIDGNSFVKLPELSPQATLWRAARLEQQAAELRQRALELAAA